MLPVLAIDLCTCFMCTQEGPPMIQVLPAPGGEPTCQPRQEIDMPHHTTPPRAVTGALALFFAGVTASVLFSDVIHTGTLEAITTAHALSLAAVVAAIASGHFAWPQLRDGNVLAAAGLVLLFAASTGYVVIASGARNGETMQAKIDRANAVHEFRSRILVTRSRAEAMLEEANGKLQAACKGGDGPNCRGVKATIEVYTAAIKGHDAELGRVGPPVTATGYTHAARILATLPGVRIGQDKIEEQLELMMPFATVLICELATIVFGHMALAGRVTLSPTSARPPNDPTISDRWQTSFPPAIVDPSLFSGNFPDAPMPDRPVGKRATLAGKCSRLPARLVAVPANDISAQPPENKGTRAEVAAVGGKHPVLTAIEQAGRPASNRELAGLMGVSEGEASKRWQEVAGQLIVGRHGRQRVLALSTATECATNLA